MAIIRFSTLVNNQTIAFNPASDVLLFDDTGISAGIIGFSYTGTSNIEFSVPGKTIKLPSTVGLSQINSNNITFADGSLFVIGDAAANTLIGTSQGDYLVGLGAADNLRGGAGADTYVVDNLADVVDETTVIGDVAAFAYDPILVSASFTDGNGNGLSFSSSVSSDGRYTLFTSNANNLVANDSNDTSDVFLRDMLTGTTQRVSTDNAGSQANFASTVSFFNGMSADGHKVVFISDADNLVASDTNAATDVFIKDIQTGSVQRISVAANGTEANNASSNAILSSDGRYVVFESDADNLVTDDTNLSKDIFIKDLQTGTIQRISVDSNGIEANANSFIDAISADASQIVFESYADNLVANDSNGYFDIFIKNTQSGQLQRVSTTASGAEAVDGDSKNGRLSADGRFLVFESTATNLVVSDSNSRADIFVKDLQTGAINRVSTTSDGTEANGSSTYAAISNDARYVVFQSDAADLVTGDTNGNIDIFIKDLQTGTVKRLSLDSSGNQATGGDSYAPTFSADGRFISFMSDATNLVANDLNGATDVFQIANPFIANLVNPYVLNADSSVDTVLALVDFTLGKGVENLTLKGNAINGTGNALSNTLEGNAENNNLDGGVGIDSMFGGQGNDTYWVDISTDVVIEKIDEGVDLVNVVSLDATDTYTLAANVENAVLKNSVTYNLLGNALDNVLTGNAAFNSIDGGAGDDLIEGAAGNDLLTDAEGNDTYRFSLGDDSDTILDSQGVDQIVFGAVISSSNISASKYQKDGSDYLLIRYGSGSDRVAIKDGLNGSIESYRFNDGTTLSHSELVGTEALPNYIEGSLHDDELNGTYDNDLLDAFGGRDQLYGLDGNDQLLGGDDEDYLNGGKGDDRLDGGSGQDQLVGEEGNDTLIGGGEGQLVIVGGAQIINGGDYLQGGAGNDIYRAGYGDNIDDNEGINTIILGVSVDTVSSTGSLAGGVNWLYANGLFIKDGFVNDSFVFKTPDGTETKISDFISEKLNSPINISTSSGVANGGMMGDVLFVNPESLLGAKLNGAGGDDTLTGGVGNDIIIGGIGNDTLQGGSGADSYRFERGFGQDVIFNLDDDALGVNADTIKFGASIAFEDIKLSKSNDHLYIKINGTDDEIRVNLFFAENGATANRVENIVFADGTTWDIATINDKISTETGDTESNAIYGNEGNNNLIGSDGSDKIFGKGGDDTLDGKDGDDILNGDNGNDTLFGRNGTDKLNGGFGNDILYGMDGDDTLNGEMDIDSLTGGAGNDLLNGGIGNDVMMGGVGNDRYTLALGDGFDAIEDTQGLNQIHFGAGITPNSLRATQYQGDDGNYYLLVQYGLGDDRVAIKDGLLGSIQNYHFDDGSVITHAELIGTNGVPLHLYGTPNADTILGHADSDVLEGGAGDDELIGLDGDDSLLGGFGTDILRGGTGDDLLDGGPGNDDLKGDAGADKYLIRWGMGQDTVVDGADGELNLITLDSGINLSDITSSRNANDLFIRFQGSKEGLLIKDYYTSIQQWQINLSTGETTTIANFLANSDTNQTGIEHLISQYKSQVKSLYYTTLGKNGFTVGSDGLLYKTVTETWEQGKSTIYYVNEFSDSTQVTDDFYVNRVVYDQNSGLELLARSQSIIKQSNIGGYASSMSGLGAGFHPHIESNAGSISYQIPQGATIVYTNNGIWIIPPFNSNSIGSTSTIFTTSSYNNYSKLTLEEIQAGFSDNTIRTWGYSVVDAGGGDDTVDGGGEGRDGDNYSSSWKGSYSEDFGNITYGIFQPTDNRNIGVLLYGNEGDDSIQGSDLNDVIIGGQGSDRLDGLGGADTYFISGDEVGTNIIIDRGHTNELGFAKPFWQYDGLAISRYLSWHHREIVELGLGDYVDYRNLSAAPVIAPDDYEALAELYESNVIELDTVEFGPGISLSAINVRWEAESLTSQYGMYFQDSEMLPEFKSLYISWGNEKAIRIGVPTWDFETTVNPDSNWNAGGWSSTLQELPTGDFETMTDFMFSGLDWTLGWGIEQFKFSDGTVISMKDMIDLVPITPVREPLIVFDVGSGNKTISYISDSKYVQIGNNSSKADFILTQDDGDLLLTHINGIDQLRIQNRLIDTLSVYFKDGGYQLYGNNQLINFGFNGDDVINSVEGFNNISLIGQGGDDTITGDSSSQILISGSGNDQLYGGLGSDHYMVDSGNGQDVVHGHDVIYESEQNSFDVDVVDIAGSVNSASFVREQDDLIISYGQYGDSITLADWYATNGNAIEFLNFTDGISWDKSTLVAMAPPLGTVNHAPIVVTEIAQQTAVEDALFTVSIPVTAFDDEDAGDFLIFSATQANGVPVPAWLTFENATLTFSGTPANANVGNLQIKLLATDSRGASVAQIFDLNITNTNDSPIVNVELINQEATENAPWIYTIPQETFTDIDIGDTLSYSATNTENTAMPSWLSFDTTTRTFSGTPLDADVGNLSIKVTATDAAGLSVSNVFDLSIANVDPSISISGSNKVNEDQPYQLNLGAIANASQHGVNQIIVNWGDGNRDSYTNIGAVNHVYADGAVVRHISVDLQDVNGLYAGVASKDVAVYDTETLGNAPSQVTRANPNAWQNAWSLSGVSISHKANITDGTEAWSNVSLNSLAGNVLTGGDVYGGDLGVSGQNLVTSTVKQEIDGSEALRFTLTHLAHEANFSLSRLFSNDDNIPGLNEAGRVQAYNGNALVGEAVFHGENPSGQQSITLDVNQGFDSLVFTAGSYDNNQKFIYAGYSNDNDQYVNQVNTTNTNVHGSDYLLDVLLIGVKPAEALL